MAHDILRFVVVTFTISWLAWAPVVAFNLHHADDPFDGAVIAIATIILAALAALLAWRDPNLGGQPSHGAAKDFRGSLRA